MAEQILSLEYLANEEALEPPGEVLDESSDENKLIEGLRKGSETAYETLIGRFEQPIYNLVYRLLRDPSEACDIVQEVFLKVFRKIGAFRGQSSLKTWIYRIAVNEAHNHCRWHGRHRWQEVGLESHEDDGKSYRDTIAAPGDSPFDYALGNEKHRLVEAALASLTPSFRAAVVLRDIEDLSYEEIGDIMEVPLGTVKSRILRGREALRADVERRLESGADFHWTPQTVE